MDSASSPSRAPLWWRTIRFTLLFPGTVVLYAPLALRASAPDVWVLPLGSAKLAGWPLIVAGVLGYLVCTVSFARSGRGTPAPWDAPSALVEGGLFRFVRNPMYVALLTTLAGEALVWSSGVHAAYTALVWFGFHARVVTYEEPVLRRVFGRDFEAYRARVPRWIPRRPR